MLQHVEPANYDEHLAQLADCDLVIEAISERMDWKKALFEKVAPHIGPDAIFASNTSGLSIGELAKVLPAALRKRFCGIHFFNPPRYMRLVELVPTADTDPEILDRLETFLTTTLGKGVIRAKDTPNFVANRVGVFSMLATMHHTLAFNLGFDEVDALTGPAIGRAKSATYRTADVVGLDTLAHVIKTMADTLPGDAWAAHYKAPAWLAGLVAKGALGHKTKGGIYTRRGKDFFVLDAATPGLPALGGRGGRRGAGHPQGEKPRAAAREAARVPPSAGAVPLGHLPRPLPLLRGAPGARSRTARATWTSPSAGASAGSAGPSRCGRRRAGSRWRNGSPRTSRRARRWRTCRCPAG